jgi:hypothetical protein
MSMCSSFVSREGKYRFPPSVPVPDTFSPRRSRRVGTLSLRRHGLVENVWLKINPILKQGDKTRYSEARSASFFNKGRFPLFSPKIIWIRF